MTQRRFSPGDRIRVLAEDRPGHVRTPGYVRGKMGRVKRVLGEFKNPESPAHGGSGLPEKPCTGSRSARRSCGRVTKVRRTTPST